jgi:hypothetical protein
MNFGLSCTLRAVVSSNGVWDASAKELESGTAIHGPLQHLQSVDLAFHNARRPRQIQRSLHGLGPTVASIDWGGVSPRRIEMPDDLDDLAEEFAEDERVLSGC